MQISIHKHLSSLSIATQKIKDLISENAYYAVPNVAIEIANLAMSIAEMFCPDAENTDPKSTPGRDNNRFPDTRNLISARKNDNGKLRYDLIPPAILQELASVVSYGAAKYGENQWQNLENFEDRYFAALMRHLIAWRLGDDIDSESGKPHLSHVLTNAAFLVYRYVSKKRQNCEKNEVTICHH